MNFVTRQATTSQIDTNNTQQANNSQQTTHTHTKTNNHIHGYTAHTGAVAHQEATSKMPVSRVYYATVDSQSAVLSASSQNARIHTHMRPDCSAYVEEALRNRDQTHYRPRTKQQQHQLFNCRTRSLLTT